jgi:hypothetical protein
MDFVWKDMMDVKDQGRRRTFEGRLLRLVTKSFTIIGHPGGRVRTPLSSVTTTGMVFLDKAPVSSHLHTEEDRV